jgi:RimJ/RimL family protein N-acetyltransferase
MNTPLAPGQIVAETPRLRLRGFTYDDAPFILRLLNEPTFIENINDKGVRDLEGARGYLRDGPLAMYARHGFGLNCVELRDSGKPIGMCGLLKRAELDDVDVGYALLPEYTGQGYAREAVTAALDAGKASHGLKRVVAVVNSGNAASLKLLDDLGFRFERMITLYANEPEIKLLARAM